MPSGNITITPGRVLGDEVVTNDKLNDIGAPTARVDENAITERELSDGAFTGDKFADDTIGAEKLAMSDLDDGDYILEVVSGVGSFKAYADAVQFPIGAPFVWPSDTAPAGCALMQGQELDRATYPICTELYAGLEGGEGDGVSTFALPDMRGVFVRGRPVGEDMGDTGGTEEETLVTDNLPAHAHTVTAVKFDGINAAQAKKLVAWPLDGEAAEGGAGAWGVDGGAASRSTNNTGGGTAHNNLPPYINFNWAVRLG